MFFDLFNEPVQKPVADYSQIHMFDPDAITVTEQDEADFISEMQSGTRSAIIKAITNFEQITGRKISGLHLENGKLTIHEENHVPGDHRLRPGF